MATTQFSVPDMHTYPLIPKLQPNAMQGTGPITAKPNIQTPLGFPEELVEDWQTVALAKFAELLKHNRALRVFLDSCVKCGACTDKCHYLLGTADPKNMPVARQDLLRQVYRRYFTLVGQYFPWLVGAKDLTREVLDDWYNYFHQCSQCRRCSVFCPYGIDTAEISMAAREILDSVGKGQKYSNEIIGKVLKIGNNLGIQKPALTNILEDLEEDLKLETGLDIRLPLDVQGAEVLLIPPSADFFAEPHIDGLLGYAKVLHQAGLAWTLSSYASEGANFGLFIGNYTNMQKVAVRIREAALALGVKRIVFGECGHAWRVAYSFLTTLAGPFDFLDSRYPVPQHICELTHELLQQGALKLDQSANEHRRLTFHDSCNVARASRMGTAVGGQFSIPRQLLQAACPHYYDMPAETIGDQTYCCGGGGGLLTDDLLELRVKGALPRMEAFQQVVNEQHVTHMVAICAICKSQFSKVLPYYGFAMDQVLSLHQVVGDALVFQRDA